MRSILSHSALAIMLAASSQVFAAPAFEPGVYVGADIGRASISSKYADDSKDVSLGFNVGYQATQNFGVELYTRSLNFRMFNGVFGDSSYYPDQHYGVAVLGAIPINERFSAYGRLGVGRTKMHSSVVAKKDYNETDPNIGAGVRFAFSQRWSMDVEFSRLTKSEVNILSTGFRFQF
ncbi:porin family protein [Oxalobacteraceae bacterium]|nr:porin family protein [Oxalobacteraceae bacterium]